jgi:hypothetical protein
MDNDATEENAQMSEVTEAPFVFTVDEFLRSHKISRGKFYQMKKKGEGPDMIEIGRKRLIPAESAAAWRKRHTKRQRAG